MKHTAPFSLIISDLHLTESRPEAMALFEQFIQQLAPQAQRIYILGDFFEFWIGDDYLTPLHQRVIDLLRLLTSHDTAVYIMHGNRDFLLGQSFIQACGAQLLRDPSVVDFYGTPTLLVHGDSLCINDRYYQLYRKVVHQRYLQWLFCHCSLDWRIWIANRLRNSNPHVDRPERPINVGHPADVPPHAAEQAFITYQVQCIIHGHTHRYAKHWHRHGVRYVMGDWNLHGSYLKVNHDGITMHDITLS